MEFHDDIFYQVLFMIFFIKSMCLTLTKGNNTTHLIWQFVSSCFQPQGHLLLSSRGTLQPMQELFFFAKAIKPPTLEATIVLVRVCSPSVTQWSANQHIDRKLKMTSDALTNVG